MKTVILFGSPRKKGNTIQLVNVMSDVLKNKGHSVRMLYLNDMNIKPCQSCYACSKEGVCKIDDDMKDIRKYMMESDLIVYAFPIYWFAPSGQLKLVIDRSLAFLDENFDSRIKGKKAITLVTYGFEDKNIIKPTEEMFKMTFDLLKLSHVGGVEAAGCERNGDIKRSFIEETRKLAESIA